MKKAVMYVTSIATLILLSFIGASLFTQAILR